MRFCLRCQRSDCCYSFYALCLAKALGSGHGRHFHRTLGFQSVDQGVDWKRAVSQWLRRCLGHNMAVRNPIFGVLMRWNCGRCATLSYINTAGLFFIPRFQGGFSNFNKLWADMHQLTHSFHQNTWDWKLQGDKMCSRSCLSHFQFLKHFQNSTQQRVFVVELPALIFKAALHTALPTLPRVSARLGADMEASWRTKSTKIHDIFGYLCGKISKMYQVWWVYGNFHLVGKIGSGVWWAWVGWVLVSKKVVLVLSSKEWVEVIILVGAS